MPSETFDELPMVRTTERWRREADDSCDIAMKARRAITPPWCSPAWNAHRDSVDEERAQGFGHFRPTSSVGSTAADTLSLLAGSAPRGRQLSSPVPRENIRIPRENIYI